MWKNIALVLGASFVAKVVAIQGKKKRTGSSVGPVAKKAKVSPDTQEYSVLVTYHGLSKDPKTGKKLNQQDSLMDIYSYDLQPNGTAKDSERQRLFHALPNGDKTAGYRGLLYDDQNEALYICQSHDAVKGVTGGQIWKYNLKEYADKTPIASNLKPFIQFNAGDHPYDMKIASEYMYVSCQTSGSIKRFPMHDTSTSFGTIGEQYGASVPRDLAVYNDRWLFVSDKPTTGTNGVRVMDLSKWESSAENVSLATESLPCIQVEGPVGMTIDEDNHVLYVGSEKTGNISMFDISGISTEPSEKLSAYISNLKEIGRISYGEGKEQMTHPAMMAIHQHRLYVVCLASTQLLSFDLTDPKIKKRNLKNGFLVKKLDTRPEGLAIVPSHLLPQH